MNISHLADQDLLVATEDLAATEREALTSILHHLKEIDRRRLYASLGYRSLFVYAVQKLKYSEDAAYRRIAAMKLLGDIPAIEQKLQNGELSLSNAAMAQKTFRNGEKVSHKKVSISEKLELLEQLENKSTRAAERLVASRVSEPLPKPDQVRELSADVVHFHFTGKKELHEKVEKLKGILSHASPDLTMGELFNRLCDLRLKEWDPSLRKTRAPQKHRVVKSSAGRIPAQIHREVWSRDGGRCIKCGSTHFLELDHKRPRTLGGEPTTENLRVLCRNRNQRAAIEIFGLGKMDPYLSRH